jgi:pyruvate kinase
MRRTKIVATLGPASDNEVRLRELIEAGMDVARVNFSHGTYEEHAGRIARIRAQAERVGKPIAILQDLQGPKIRTGPLKGGGPALLENGETFTITTEPNDGNARRVSTTYQNLPQDVQPNDRILLSDGLIELLVTGVHGTDVDTQVIQGGALRQHQGINLPGTAVSTSAITEKDRADLMFGLEQKVDYVAMSFVRRAADVQQLRELISASGAKSPIVAKIEKPQALDDLPAILEVTDVVMVARGDLGVEMSPEHVPLAQKTIIHSAAEQNVVVITATQMLESMIQNPRPTRAEASDVANAIFDGTDAIMLSGETAVGKFPVEAIQMMHRIATTIESSTRYAEQQALLNSIRSSRYQADSSLAISHAARVVAETVDVAAIVAFTQSGYTARLVSKDRPPVPIFALTPDPQVARQLALYWGVKPMICPSIDRLDDLTEYMANLLLEQNCVQRGDRVVMTGGHPLAARGATNFIKIVEIT